MIKLLHFADAHIDMARQGRHDPESGLPLRVLDFLKALDVIMDAALEEKADLVIFAGDAYRDRSPAPTYQREWGKRMMRLSGAGIQTVLVIGNHDVSPAAGRAHTLQEFDTLQVPHIHVISRPCLLGPQDLNGLPVQVIGIPWLTRSAWIASNGQESMDTQDIGEVLEGKLTGIIEDYLSQLDPDLPSIFTSHVSIQGASYGNERSVMLGRDLVLPASLVKDSRLDYVALGHIHKAQNLNEGSLPPVIYPGSIERLDFGEVDDRKTFMIAEIEKGAAPRLDWRELQGRQFIDLSVEITSAEDVQDKIMAVLPPPDVIREAIVRLVLVYPRGMEALIDEPAIRLAARDAFEFHLIRRPRMQVRLRLSADKPVAALSPMELLDLYWKSIQQPTADTRILNDLAVKIIQNVESGGETPLLESEGVP
jgi:exonuclease SbcD